MLSYMLFYVCMQCYSNKCGVQNDYEKLQHHGCRHGDTDDLLQPTNMAVMNKLKTY